LVGAGQTKKGWAQNRSQQIAGRWQRISIRGLADGNRVKAEGGRRGPGRNDRRTVAARLENRKKGRSGRREQIILQVLLLNNKNVAIEREQRERWVYTKRVILHQIKGK